MIVERWSSAVTTTTASSGAMRCMRRRVIFWSIGLGGGTEIVRRAVGPDQERKIGTVTDPAMRPTTSSRTTGWRRKRRAMWGGDADVCGRPATAIFPRLAINAGGTAIALDALSCASTAAISGNRDSLDRSLRSRWMASARRRDTVGWLIASNCAIWAWL